MGKAGSSCLGSSGHTQWTGDLSRTQGEEGFRILSCFNGVQLFSNPWTIAHQAPLSLGFFRQEYWSGLPCPPGNLPDLGIEPMSIKSPELSNTWEAREGFQS